MSRIFVTGRKTSSDSNPIGARLSLGSSLEITKRMSSDGKPNSVNSGSAENVGQGSSLAHSFDEIEEELANIAFLPKEEQIPYVPPPVNYIRVLYGASQIIIINGNCRRKIFVHFLTKRLGVRNSIPEGSVLDLCNEEGTMLKLSSVDGNGNINHLFKRGTIYIPCIVSLTDAGFMESITPWLKRWEKLYPTFEEIFNTIIRQEQEEARKRERNMATLAAVANVEEKKDKEKESDSKQDKKKKGK